MHRYVYGHPEHAPVGARLCARKAVFACRVGPGAPSPGTREDGRLTEWKGYPLVSSNNATGYRCVMKRKRPGILKPYTVRIEVGGFGTYYGHYETATEAALAYAQMLGKEAAAAAAAEARDTPAKRSS